MNVPFIDKIELTITVSGGTGYADFIAVGTIKKLLFVVPIGTGAFDVEITDFDGDEVCGAGGVTPSGATRLSVLVDEGNLYKNNRITISNAATDGTYGVVVPFLLGESRR